MHKTAYLSGKSRFWDDITSRAVSSDSTSLMPHQGDKVVIDQSGRRIEETVRGT
jgi:hypothetical protein